MSDGIELTDQVNVPILSERENNEGQDEEDETSDTADQVNVPMLINGEKHEEPGLDNETVDTLEQVNVPMLGADDEKENRAIDEIDLVHNQMTLSTETLDVLRTTVDVRTIHPAQVELIQPQVQPELLHLWRASASPTLQRKAHMMNEPVEEEIKESLFEFNPSFQSKNGTADRIDNRNNDNRNMRKNYHHQRKAPMLHPIDEKDPQGNGDMWHDVITRETDQEASLMNISNEKDKSQVASTTAMMVIHVGILKALLDLGPQGVRFYHVSLVLVILALVLQFISGIISVYLTTMRKLQKKHIALLSTLNCCKGCCTTDEDESTENEKMKSLANYSIAKPDQDTLENIHDQQSKCCGCRKRRSKSKDNRNVAKEYHNWQDNVWKMQLEAADADQKMVWLLEEISNLRKKYLDLKFKMKEEDISRQVYSADKSTQKERNNVTADDMRIMDINMGWIADYVDTLESQDQRFWQLAERMSTLKSQCSELLDRAISQEEHSKKESSGLEEKIKETQQLLADKEGEFETLKQLKRKWILFLQHGKVLQGHADIVSKDSALEMGAYWQNILNFIIYIVLVLNTLITGFGLANIGLQEPES